MGSLLSFAPRSAATTRKPVAAGSTASVIIFPGVRYERPDPVYGGYKTTPTAKPRSRQARAPLPAESS